MGDPDPAFSFSRMLQVLLEKKYPDKKIEIYNTAVTAINSHVLIPIAEDCLKLEPDLFIVYAGNNEVIGPFGLSAALSPFLSNVSLIKAKIWLGQFRIGQLLSNIKGGDELDQREWRGMEMFMKNQVRYDNPELEIIYNNFQANLSEICDKAHRAGVKVILSTIITNLKDCAPFLSLHKKDLSNQILQEWETKFKEGIQFEVFGQYEQAIELYLQCAKLDDEYAELNFRLATCFNKVGRTAKAIETYTRAQDFDALRFRADSRINEIIKRVVFSRSEKGVLLADAKGFALEQTEEKVTGLDLLYEHVHLNPKGNFVLANCISQQVENSLGLPHSMEVVDLKACKSRLAYTPFDERRIDEINVSRLSAPPFTAQFSNNKEIRALKEKISGSFTEIDTHVQSHTKTTYEQAIKDNPADWFLRLNYLRFLNRFKYDVEALSEAEVLYSLLPHEYLSSINLGVTRKALLDYREAEVFFLRAIEINPYFSEAYMHMIALLEDQRDYFKLVPYFDRSGVSSEAIAKIYNRAGIHFINENSPDSAIMYFHKAIDINANFPEAHQNLRLAIKLKNQALTTPSPSRYMDDYNKANDLFRQGNFRDALYYYQKALKVTPSFAQARNNMGICLIQLNQLVDARQNFEEAINNDPDFYDAYLNLGAVLYEQGQYNQVIKVLEKGLKIKYDADVYHLLASSYLQLGDKLSSAKFLDYEQKVKKGLPLD